MTHMLKPTVRPKLKLPNFLHEMFNTTVFVAVVLILFDMAFPRSVVDGASMEPSFYDGERLFVSRVHYLLSHPQQGDVVVFNSVERPDNEMLIKRVIGLPGDIIEFRDGEVLVNDERLPEAYINVCDFKCNLDNTWEVPENAYFVMGDNRDRSNDSRDFNFVPIESIVGRVILRFWDITRLGIITRPDY